MGKRCTNVLSSGPSGLLFQLSMLLSDYCKRDLAATLDGSRTQTKQSHPGLFKFPTIFQSQARFKSHVLTSQQLSRRRLLPIGGLINAPRRWSRELAFRRLSLTWPTSSGWTALVETISRWQRCLFSGRSSRLIEPILVLDEQQLIQF